MCARFLARPVAFWQHKGKYLLTRAQNQWYNFGAYTPRGMCYNPGGSRVIRAKKQGQLPLLFFVYAFYKNLRQAKMQICFFSPFSKMLSVNFRFSFFFLPCVDQFMHDQSINIPIASNANRDTVIFQFPFFIVSRQIECIPFFSNLISKGNFHRLFQPQKFAVFSKIFHFRI